MLISIKQDQGAERLF